MNSIFSSFPQFGKYFLIGFLPLFLTSCQFPFAYKTKAALTVTASPQSTVFLNDKKLGNTPYYSQDLVAGSYTLKVVPEQAGILEWQGQINLYDSVETIVSRELGQTEDTSGGYVLTLEPQADKTKSNLLVVTKPEGAVVSFGDKPKGFAPITVDDQSEGPLNVTMSSPGYFDKSIVATLIKGYKTTANISLIKDFEQLKMQKRQLETSDALKIKESETSAPSDTVVDLSSSQDQNSSDMVEILNTPTGWLNARKTPSSSEDNVIKQLKPKEKYKYLDDNHQGWLKIDLGNNTPAWVSDQYTKIVKS